MGSYSISGNACIFFSYKVFNFLLLLEGLLVIALGIWLWQEIKEFNLFSIIFISLGVLEFILSIIGC